MRSIEDIEFFDGAGPKFGEWKPAFQSTRWAWVMTTELAGMERDG